MRYKVTASFVIGGWSRIVSQPEDLARVIQEGIDASPIGEVIIRKLL